MSTERLSPAEAFEILGDDIRLAILRALKDDREPIQFSELRDRTGVDDSGRFNYHLDRLRGHFVRRTDDGYELRYQGKRVVETVMSGTFTDTATVGPFPVEGTCYACEGALEGCYEDERVTIRCTACDERIISIDFPPSALQGRSPDELMAAYSRWSGARMELAVDGVCPACGGRVEWQLFDPESRLPFEVLPSFECVVCTNRAATSFAALALRNPIVESFYADHGIDVTEHPYWDIEPCVTGEYTTVESRDPLDVEVGFPAGEETLRVRLNDEFDVVRTARERV